MIHDADLDDARFQRVEAVGIDRVLKGWAKQDYLTRRFCDAALNASTHSTPFCSGDELHSREENDSDADHRMPSWREVFLYFLFLGFVNIGGPVAQITMMFNHMVEKRRWLSKDRFVKIMAFCHMLPGPEVLQLAIYVGYLKRKSLGRHFGWSYFHSAGRNRDGDPELVLCSLWQAASVN